MLAAQGRHRDGPNFTNSYRRAIRAIHGAPILHFILTLIPSSGPLTERHTHMKSTFKPLLLAALLAGTGLAASAQGMGAGGGMQHDGVHLGFPELICVRRRQARGRLVASVPD